MCFFFNNAYPQAPASLVARLRILRSVPSYIRALVFFLPPSLFLSLDDSSKVRRLNRILCERHIDGWQSMREQSRAEQHSANRAVLPSQSFKRDPRAREENSAMPIAISGSLGPMMNHTRAKSKMKHLAPDRSFDRCKRHFSRRRENSGKTGLGFPKLPKSFPKLPSLRSRPCSNNPATA